MSLKSQDEYLTRFYSLPVVCPSCGNLHSYIEARGSSDWSKETIAKCPKTGSTLIVQVPVLGGDYYLSLKQAREMSDEESQEWDALQDQSDWMTDEQMQLESEKIRTKYKTNS